MNTHRLIAAILIMGFLSRLFGCGNSNEATAPASEYEQADVYRGMRGKVLGLKPEMIGLPSGATDPLAVLMEMGDEDAVSTLVCVADGSVSLYFSTGGGIIGAGGHAPVRTAGLAMIQRATELCDHFNPVESFPLPRPDSVRFYLITSGGVRSVEAGREIGSAQHVLYPMFVAGNEVIARTREHTPDS